MRKGILEISLDWLRQGRDVAIATVIATWGSSPRPVGSQMIVDANGNFEGSVSGGCIEAAVITEAKGVISEGRPRRLEFGVTEKEAWDVGLACGGTIEIYIETAAPHGDIIAKCHALVQSGKFACLVTDLSRGIKLIVPLDSTPHTSSPPAQIQETVNLAMRNKCSRLTRINDTPYFIHLLHPEPRLFIVGAVHIAGPLAGIAQLAGFKVTIVDPRKAFASAERFPDIILNTQWPDEALTPETLNARSAVVALTHDPKLDDTALKAALASDAFFIGALGSRKTHASRMERLGQDGFDPKTLDRIHGPVGLPINAVSPEEIAVAIMAQIIEQYREIQQ